MTRALVLALLVSLAALAAPAAQLPLPPDEPAVFTRTPALSPDGNRLCFSWQGNLWTVPRGGGAAVRLTANECFDSNPRWSPDGRWIAFNSDREGGTQVFLIPSAGGPARQVTFHGSPTVLFDWFPDNESLLVGSNRENRRVALYRLHAGTGVFRLLWEDSVNLSSAAVSPDGRRVAFTRGALVDQIRKGYRGSANFDVWTLPADGSEAPVRLTDSDRNDMWPVWGDDSRTVYFVSERGGTAAIWKQRVGDREPRPVVADAPDAARYLTGSRNGDWLTYECENRAWVARASDGKARRCEIFCRTDERGPAVTHAVYNGTEAGEFQLSPDGKRMAFTVRGDVFVTTLGRTGDARRLTDNPTRDGEISWSPDGKTIAFSSNRDGAYRVYSVDAAGGQARRLTSGPRDTDPSYSPDGKWIAFLRGPKTSLWAVRPDGSEERRLLEGPGVAAFHWAPDSRWIAAQKEDEIRNDDIWAVPVPEAPDPTARPVNVTDYPCYNTAPVWFRDGSRIAFRSNRTRNRDIETINHQGRYALFTVSTEPEKEKLDDQDEPEPTKPPGEMKPPAVAPVKLDPREIEHRAKEIVGSGEGVGAFAVSPDGKTIVLVLRTNGQSDLWQVSADGGNLQRLTTTGESPQQIQWAPDSSRFYWLRGGTIRQLPRGGGAPATVPFTVRMEIERRVDYQAAYDEILQVINDVFYDPTFHGQDWRALGEKYRPLVGRVTGRRDFNYLVTQLFGELNASHTGITYPPGFLRSPRATGYLGVWIDETAPGPGVRIRKVLPRGPADRAESRMEVGETILSVDGREVAPGASYDRALEDRAGRTVSLQVRGAGENGPVRTVRLKPLARARYAELLYEEWVDGRRAAVEKASGGRLAYLHVDDMGDAARNRFERELFSRGIRSRGVVLDLRDNGGGDTHDSLLRILERRKHYFFMHPRLEAPFPQPERAFPKPVVLLINEGSLSDAEVFANGFRELGLGRIVGVPTMGWIIFTSGWRLLDGSTIRTPHMGCFTRDGRDMENWGVPPDLRVEYTPADHKAGRDPQLDAAVAELLKQLPPETPAR